MNELKPCPFCGGEAEVRKEDTSNGKSYHVTCTNKHLVYLLGFNTEEQAIKAWNRRIPVTKLG